MSVYDYIKETKLVPVVVLNNIEDTIPTIGALVEGGLPIAEICFRTECAKEAIKLAHKMFPDACIGAGTVINEEQCLEAIDAGAKFIVSPGLSEAVAMVCKEKDVLYLPGVVTPAEIMKAICLGLTTLKYFPASEFGGIKAIKGLCAAFPQIEIMPTGGINENNIMEYLSFKKIIACGGSWMVKGSRSEITEKTKKALSIIRGEL